MENSFVHLHLHSEYSLLDGACRIAEIPKKAKEEGHFACAITDHGAMYGTFLFYNACKAEGIKPIIGCEVYVAKRTRFDKTYGEDSDFSHLILLCENDEGYRNLIRMVSDSFTEGFYIKPRIDKDLLRSHSKGLIALSGCLSGRIPKLILQGLTDEAMNEAKEMEDIFGKNNFFLEIQNHGIQDELKVIQGIKKISETLGIPMVATNDVHYLRRADADTQRVMLCIQTNTKITDKQKIGFETDEFYYKSTREMEELFASIPEAIKNTVEIAKRCNFDFKTGKYFLPAYTPPENLTPEKYLRKLAEEGLVKRLSDGDIIYTNKHPAKEYRERIEYELSVITGMGYAEYYLIVWDFVNFAKSKGIPVGPGRGSGAGSLIAYLIRITDVNPMRFELIFERFLNPERVSMPDFDIDFCYIRREEVIKYVTEKYGDDHVSQIITFGTMAAKAAIRDAARAMGLPYSDGDAVVKAMPKKFGSTIADAEKNKEFKELAESSPTMQKLINTAKALEGMPRHASVHAAGVVISDKPIWMHVPLATSGEARVTQFDMNTIAELGLLKFDFLGLRYLTVISDAEKMIRKHTPDFDICKIPENDKKTFDMLKAGQAVGVFQLESAGMRQMLSIFRPESIDDIMIAISVYRPGPMDNIPKLVENRRKGKIEYDLPELSGILDSTYGCVIYQEQVMQILRKLASYSFGKADVVRKAISKKKPEIIAMQRESFLEGCKQNGIDLNKAAAIFDDIVGFAGYAFNKSHAAAYSVLAYRTAYLKANYPSEFFAALMTSELGNRTKLAEYMAETSKIGIKILPPSVNESDIDFSADKNSIRYGLSALKNVGIGFVNRMLEERTRFGKFKSFTDFAERMYGRDMNRKQLETLIKSGAFDSLGVYRSRLLDRLDDTVTRISEKNKETITGQMSMFNMVNSPVAYTEEYPDIPEFPLKVLLSLEREASGMYFSGHITSEYSKNIEDTGSVSIGSVLNSFDEISPSGEFTEGQNVIISGVITDKTVKTTKKGDNMAFISLEDASGEMEIIVFPKIYNEFMPLLINDNVLAVYGEISVKEEENAKLFAKAFAPLRTNEIYTHRPSPFEEFLERDSKKPINNHSYQNKSNNYANNGNNQKPLHQTKTPHTVENNIINANKIFIRVDSFESKKFKQSRAMCEIFEGITPVIFYSKESASYEKPPYLKVRATEFLISEFSELLGKENVVVK